jgi:hypothetical protein
MLFCTRRYEELVIWTADIRIGPENRSCSKLRIELSGQVIQCQDARVVYNYLSFNLDRSALEP